MFKIIISFVFIATFIAPLFNGQFWLSEVLISFYPQIFVAHFLGLIFFLFMRWKKIVVVGIGFLCFEGYNLSKIYFNPVVKNDLQDYKQLKVFQFNAYFYNENYELLTNHLQNQNDYDLIFVCEATQALKTGLKKLYKKYPYFQYCKQDHLPCGLAILSKYPFTVKNPYRFEKTPIIFEQVDVRYTNSLNISFYGVHLQSPQNTQMWAQRNDQLKHLAKMVNQNPGQNKMVVGDLNVAPFAKAFQDFLKTSKLKDYKTSGTINFPITKIFHGSWPIWLPKYLRTQIDHCLVSDSIEIIDHEIGPDLGSDHLPIITTLLLPRN